MRRPIIPLLFTFWLLVLGLTGCGPSEQSPLRLGTNIWPGYEPLYLAQELGMLPERQVRLIEHPSASEVLRAFRNKNLDAASLTLDEALLLSQSGMPVRIILIHDISDGADVIMAKPEIGSVEALRGKRIAVESGALGAYVLTRALQLHQLDIQDVHIQHLAVNAHESSYKQGNVDAAVTFEPMRTRLLNAGAREIFNSREMPGEIVDVLVVHEDVYQQRLPTLKSLVDAWFQALDHLDRETDKAASIMARRLKITPAEVIASYDGLKLPNRADNLALLDGSQAGLLDTMTKLEKVLRDNNLLQRAIDTRKLPGSAPLH